MAKHNLVNGLIISETAINGKCKDCIVGCQMWHLFDSETEKNLKSLELFAFDLWGLSHVQSTGGKIYLIIIVDEGTSYKYGVYLSDKSNATTIPAFKIFCTKAETVTGRKIHQLQTD